MPPQNQYPPNQPNPMPPQPGGMYPGQFPPPQKTPDPDRKRKILTLIPVVLAGILLIAGIGVMVLSSQPEETTTVSTSAADFSTYDTAYDQWRVKGVVDFEVDEKDKTLDSLNTLASDFSFKPEVEADMIDRLIVLGVAKMHSENKIDTETAKNRLYLVLQDKLGSVPSGITDENKNLATEDQALGIYDKYQNKQLTQKVKDTIKKRSLESEAIQKLQLKEEELQEYQLYALDFDSQTPKEEEFRTAMGYEGWLPSLFTQSYPDTRIIGFTKKFAQEFVKKKDSATKAYFLHEFSHTQSPLRRGESAYLLEERRAEEISGNRGAYYDVKQFFIYLEVLTGYDALGVIQQGPVEVERIYTDLYSTLGVELADAVVASFPVAYLGGTTPIKEVSRTQNMDEVMKIAKSYGETNDPDTQLKRINDRGLRLIEIFGSKEAAIKDLETNLAQSYQMPFMAELMINNLNNR